MIKPRKAKLPASSSNESFGELEVLRKEAMHRNDPNEIVAKIKEISACNAAANPAIAHFMATRLAFFKGFEMLLSVDFASERVKQPFPKGDPTFLIWQVACDCALKGALQPLMIFCS